MEVINKGQRCLQKRLLKKVKEIKMDKIEIGKARAARIEPSGRCGFVLFENYNH